jgi:uncharacterized protein (TIGR03032 family)
MGMAITSNSLYVASIGNIFRYVKEVGEVGKRGDTEVVFDASYYPRQVLLCGDHDLHDLKVNSKGDVFYVSSLFNCVCRPSFNKSFEVFWVPPWITSNALGELAQEDRCHLNGLCLVDDVPKYVTAASQGDIISIWKEKKSQKKGVVYDIVENKVVCEGLSHPHSPKYHNGKLWILESGTGQVGWIDMENSKFMPMKFIPGFLRGMYLVDNFLFVCSSLDRHDTAFDHIALGDILAETGIDAKCGVWILNLDTFDLIGNIQFNNVKELYDIVVMQNTVNPVLFTVDNGILMNKFHVEDKRVKK